MSNVEFKAPDDREPIRVSTTEGGATAIVGHEWRELPINLHRLAIAAGCEIKGRSVIEAENIQKHTGPGIEEKAILDALKQMIEREDESDWTKAGQPDLRVLASLCGFSPNKEQVYGLFNELKTAADEADEELEA